jgi:CO/xanthine dehydrogenase Mo-binding subunit
MPGEAESSLDIHYAYCFASAAVAVEVDTETGAVRALKVCAAQDSGVAINPMSVRGQIEGAVAMGLGYALSEQFVSNELSLVTDDLAKLGLPKISDVPPIEVTIVEVPQPGGPYGAKGMGEVGLNPIAPAVSNAIFDAIGARLRSLPMSPAKLLAAYRGAFRD